MRILYSSANPLSMCDNPVSYLSGVFGRLSPEKCLDLLMAAAASGLLPERIEMLGWQDDIQALLAGCDIVMLSSDVEGLLQIVVEAMAAVRPDVATRVGGVPELVRDGESGLLVELGDAEGLIAALRSLLTDLGRRSLMGTLARNRFESHFSQEQMVAKLEEMYQELLEC